MNATIEGLNDNIDLQGKEIKTMTKMIDRLMKVTMTRTMTMMSRKGNLRQNQEKLMTGQELGRIL